MNEPARSESLDARAWWTLAVVVAVVLIAYLGLSAGRMSSHDDARPDASRSTSPSGTASSVPATEETEGSTDDSLPETPSDRSSGVEDTDPGSEPLDAQSLREFGELGVLPGLLDDFSSVPDCDFDDALSTCQ